MWLTTGIVGLSEQAGLLGLEFLAARNYDFSRMHDVVNRNEAAHQRASDQVVTMTIVVIGFAAHEGDSAGCAELNQPLDGPKVKWRARQPVIVYLALAVIEFRAMWPAA